MKTKTINLYEFDELSDDAKEKAREWWRECESNDFGGHGELFEGVEEIAGILGVTFNHHNVPLMGGGKRSEPDVWWQLHSQGSGASFTGRYQYAKDSVKRIKAYAPKDEELHRIAKELQALQKGYRYGFTAVIITSGRSVHSNSMDLEAYNAEGHDAKPKDADTLLELMRDFANWIFDGLNKEWEYRMGDENVDESIRINEYTFTEDGKRMD